MTAVEKAAPPLAVETLNVMNRCLDHAEPEVRFLARALKQTVLATAALVQTIQDVHSASPVEALDKLTEKLDSMRKGLENGESSET